MTRILSLLTRLKHYEKDRDVTDDGELNIVSWWIVDRAARIEYAQNVGWLLLLE
jgi:hypothetical protein